MWTDVTFSQNGRQSSDIHRAIDNIIIKNLFSLQTILNVQNAAAKTSHDSNSAAI